MVSKSCEVRLKLERHYAEALDCLRNPVYTRITSSALCLFPFLAAMGSSAAVPPLAPTEEWCRRALSWVGVPAKVAHACWASGSSWVCWETWGSKVFCSSSLSPDKPWLTEFMWRLLGSFPVLLHLLSSAQPIMGRCQNFSFLISDPDLYNTVEVLLRLWDSGDLSEMGFFGLNSEMIFLPLWIKRSDKIFLPHWFVQRCLWKFWRCL